MPGGQKFKRARAKRAADGKPCECWDCIRADGLTPSAMQREAHARLYPRTLYLHDPKGVPTAGHPEAGEHGETGGSGDGAGANAEEAAHLRAAVRNREAI